MRSMIVSRYKLNINTGFSNAAASLYRALKSGGEVSVVDEVKAVNLYTFSIYILYLIFKIRITKLFFRIFLLIKFRLKVVHFLEDWNLALQAKNLMKNNNFDLIVVETGLLPLCVISIQSKIKSDKLKTIVTPRFHATEDVERFRYSSEGADFIHFKFLIRKMLNKTDHICATNSYHLLFLKTNILKNNPYVVYDKNFHVIPNGLGKLNLMQNVREIDGLEACSWKPINFLFCGKLSQVGIIQKGLKDLLTVFVDLHPKAELKLKIAGTGTELKSLRDEYQIYSNIEFLGQITNDEIISQIDASDYVILPSRFEGQSIFLLECLSRSRPLILTEKTGSSGLVSEGNGYLVPPGNLDELRRTILDAQDVSLHDWLVMCDRSLNVYLSSHTEDKILLACRDLLRSA